MAYFAYFAIVLITSMQRLSYVVNICMFCIYVWFNTYFLHRQYYQFRNDCCYTLQHIHKLIQVIFRILRFSRYLKNVDIIGYKFLGKCVGWWKPLVITMLELGFLWWFYGWITFRRNDGISDTTWRILWLPDPDCCGFCRFFCVSSISSTVTGGFR